MTDVDDVSVDFTPSRLKEKPRDDLSEWCWRNWMQVSDFERASVISALRDAFPETVQLHWARQVEQGVRIGSDDPWFHMGNGMVARNIARQTLPDNMLPRVIAQDGIVNSGYQGSWDDFYTGALEELAGKELDGR